MATAIARIVVQATTEDKKAIVSKAKRLKLPVSELMRRGAFAYERDESDEELALLADAAKAAAERSSAAIDDALEFIAASNRRIAAMEANVHHSTTQPGAPSTALPRRVAARKRARHGVSSRKGGQ